MTKPTKYDDLQTALRTQPQTWLVTGAAGFIGSHLVEKLLGLNQRVVGLDNFATGHRRNLDEVQGLVTPEQWAHFRFIEGDICRLRDCNRACSGADYVLHQAALGSVPRSIEDPLRSHASNVTGFLNMLVAARDAKVKRFVYASSSSVYGDHPALPKVEGQIGAPMSPYAATKLIDELYAQVFARCYNLPVTGLRYFNVFGPRQDPNGHYAAVIPRWIKSALAGKKIIINGDGITSRDFCYVANVVQANILAAVQTSYSGPRAILNVGCNQSTSLNDLAQKIIASSGRGNVSSVTYVDARKGDVRHSLANIQAATDGLGYLPSDDIASGLSKTIAWYNQTTTE